MVCFIRGVLINLCVEVGFSTGEIAIMKLNVASKHDALPDLLLRVQAYALATAVLMRQLRL